MVKPRVTDLSSMPRGFCGVENCALQPGKVSSVSFSKASI